MKHVIFVQYQIQIYFFNSTKDKLSPESTGIYGISCIYPREARLITFVCNFLALDMLIFLFSHKHLMTFGCSVYIVYAGLALSIFHVRFN